MKPDISPDPVNEADQSQDARQRHILDGYLSEEEYARQRGVTVRTCQRDRERRDCPPYLVFGKRIYYRLDAIRTWLKARERKVDPHPARRSR